MTINIESSQAEFTKELSRLGSQPNPRMISALEDVLDETFLGTQALVHVITGSLRGSGKTSSKYEPGQWSGMIEYGGPSPGFPNNPVDYAIYERARGGSHDFLSNVHLMNERFEQAIAEEL